MCQATGREKEDRAAAWLLTRLGIGTFLTMCALLLSWLLSERQIHAQGPEIVFLIRWGIWALATPVLILLGYPLLKQGVLALGNRSLSLEGAIGVVCVVLYGISFVNLCQGREGIYFSTVCATILLVTLGKILEATSKSAAAKDVRDFLGREKTPAFRIEDDRVEHTTAANLEPGDIVRVPRGYTVPADGKVLEGRSRVRLTPLTGERDPVVRQVDDEILEGGQIIDETLTIQVLRTGMNTVLAHLLSVIERAALVPSKRRYLVDRALDLFRPLIMVAAACTLFWWWPINRTEAWFNLLAVLVIACPCALVLTTPIATTLAVARAAREGILISEAAAVERLSAITACFFDETDSPHAAVCGSEESISADEETFIAGGSVRHSATAVMSYPRTERSTPSTETNRSPRVVELCAGLHEKGLRTVLLAEPSLIAGCEHTRLSVIDGIYMGISPQEKSSLIRSYRNQGYRIALISKEHRDSQNGQEPDIHVAVGATCEGGIPNSPIVLLGGDLERLPWLIDLSRRAFRTVNWNLAWSSFYSIVGMFGAAAGIIHPVFAATAMLVGSLLVASNTAQIHNHPGPSFGVAKRT
ncbi:MAG: HAD-IC family P-type ATPase [bacterium]